MRTLAFSLLFAGLFLALNCLFQPVWYDWNNYDTTHGFYEEPENTIETVFLGASIVANGITPMELYEDYGICSYNLGMEQQPMAVSYYWLEEVYRLQGDSLKTVVFEPSVLTGEEREDAFYRKGLDAMEFSPVKWRAIRDYTDGSLTQMLSYLIPLLSYHNRWTELEETDFTKQQYELKDYVRGYNFTTTSLFDEYEDPEFNIINYYPDTEAEEKQLNTEALYYMRKMIDFCEAHNLKLVLIKAPRSSSSSAHNAVQTIADHYGLDFFDFSCEPLVSELGYNHAADSADGSHMNYYGAAKLTAWLGQYLTEECDATDVRGNPAYQFMEEQLEKYHENVTDLVKLKEIRDPAEYLSFAASHENYMVFLSVRDEAAGALTDEQRRAFTVLGLDKLSELGYRDSYLAVIDEGTVLLEQVKENPEESEKSVDNDLEHITIEDVRESRLEEETENTTLELVYEGRMSDGTSYLLKSGGLYLGNVSSVLIDETEYSLSGRGINIVVYDKAKKQVFDSTTFDTCAFSEREGNNLEAALESALSETDDITALSSDLQKLYFYNLRCEDAKYATALNQSESENALSDYLNTALQNDRYAIFLSVMEEASQGLGSDERAKLAALGFENLSKLEQQDSYVAVAIGGQVLYEMSGQGETPVSVSDLWTAANAEKINYRVESGGAESGNVSSVTMINGKEYSAQSKGINIVIWDTVIGQIVDVSAFASGETVSD